MVDEAVPKVELHCHLIGVLNSEILSSLKASGEPVLVPPESVTPVGFNEGDAGFAAWLTRVEPYKTAPWKTFLPILAAHIERLVAQNVIYAELMISPMMFSRDLGEAVEEFAQFREFATAAERGRIQVEFLFLVPRSLPDEFISKDIERCVRLSGPGGISGISIAGLERDCPVGRFARMFRALKDHGLGIEIHAGELDGPDGVREALDVGLADRIGHGIRAFEDEDLVRRLADQQVHVEFCPTSNIKMGVVRDMSRHPIGRACDLGMNFSINTDDPGAFGCDMNGEFDLAAVYFDFRPADFMQVARNSLNSRFEPMLRGAALEFMRAREVASASTSRTLVCDL